MKKTIEYMQLWLLAGMLLAVGCTADFEDLNRNPNQVTDSQMDVMNYKTGTKVKALQSLVVPVQEHMYQFNESLVGGPFGGDVNRKIQAVVTLDLQMMALVNYARTQLVQYSGMDAFEGEMTLFDTIELLQKLIENADAP